MLKDTIIADLTTAMKERDEVGKRTLRMLKAEIMKEEVAGKVAIELSDTDVAKLAKRLIKQRHDAIAGFEQGGNTASADAEREEIAVLEKYAPEQMSQEKIAEIIVAKKAELGIDDQSKMGQLMGVVMKEVGDAADGTAVKEEVMKSFK